MMKEVLFNLIRKHHLNISIYTEEIFERRCQEEIIRSDEEKSSFVYLEFDFNNLRQQFKDEEEFNEFWAVLMVALNKNNRGSDIIGFLENQSGLGMLLLDSKIEGWIRIKGRIQQTAANLGFQSMGSVLDDAVKPIIYPTCIQELGSP
ncbi:MAG: hypothetical protein MJY82_09460 [Fibrobacter sp.]|nr:hypothetical protein [Fibrobacter sp.]